MARDLVCDDCGAITPVNRARYYGGDGPESPDYGCPECGSNELAELSNQVGWFVPQDGETIPGVQDALDALQDAGFRVSKHKGGQLLADDSYAVYAGDGREMQRYVRIRGEIGPDDNPITVTTDHLPDDETAYAVGLQLTDEWRNVRGVDVEYRPTNTPTDTNTPNESQ